VGIFKYTAQPNIIISSNGINFNPLEGDNILTSEIYGTCSIEQDISESVYSYRFDIYQYQNNNLVLIDTSGEQLHNAEVN
jgi:hypothetical protein